MAAQTVAALLAAPETAIFGTGATPRRSRPPPVGFKRLGNCLASSSEVGRLTSGRADDPHVRRDLRSVVSLIMCTGGA